MHKNVRSFVNMAPNLTWMTQMAQTWLMTYFLVLARTVFQNL
jgi:hypothetical protein